MGNIIIIFMPMVRNMMVVSWPVTETLNLELSASPMTDSHSMDPCNITLVRAFWLLTLIDLSRPQIKKERVKSTRIPQNAPIANWCNWMQFKQMHAAVLKLPMVIHKKADSIDTSFQIFSHTICRKVYHKLESSSVSSDFSNRHRSNSGSGMAQTIWFECFVKQL